jgi:hypothetical protein
MGIKRVLVATTLMMAFGLAAEAENIDVDYLKYTNKGAYDAWLILVWVDSNGNKHVKQVSDNIGSDHSKVIGLDLIALKGSSGDDNHSLVEGDEVWLSVQIQAGEKKNCRKDTKKFFYKDGSGKQVEYKTSGTTLNNNRCKIKGIGTP